MYKKTTHASHPDSMARADNQALRDRYLMSDCSRPAKSR